jgi:hypothetical protein
MIFSRKPVSTFRDHALTAAADFQLGVEFAVLQRGRESKAGGNIACARLKMTDRRRPGDADRPGLRSRRLRIGAMRSRSHGGDGDGEEELGEAHDGSPRLIFVPKRPRDGALYFPARLARVIPERKSCARNDRRVTGARTNKSPSSWLARNRYRRARDSVDAPAAGIKQIRSRLDIKTPCEESEINGSLVIGKLLGRGASSANPFMTSRRE